MRRRELLGAVGTTLIAGCTSLDGGGNRTDTGDTTGETAETSLTARSFLSAGGDCGTQTDEEPEVEFDDKNLSVSVSGVLNGRDTCETAELASATYSSEDERLRVEVETVERDTDKMCADCITEIEYTAEFGFKGSLPSEVEVVESDANGRDSTTVSRTGSSS